VSGSPRPILPCLLISFDVQCIKCDKSTVSSTPAADKAIDLALVSQFGMEMNLIVFNCVKCGYQYRNLQVATSIFLSSNVKIKQLHISLC